MEDEERFLNFTRKEVLSLSDKTEWYKLYFKKTKQGSLSDFVSEVAGRVIVCRHRDVLSQNKEVQEIFMTMFCDCLFLTRDLILPWLEGHGLPKSFCECGESAFDDM
ncbi:hypothetical protein A9K97_gp019 [Tokyovirus A1]|uniref:hypothetical protein n=1 Tax=Tokyovirus A1 TaxID=1826170 RepID=UPI0007A972B4|nr:hypothetical protein A9K97_gp019 [Tokyovirus A1]BAU80332.1 hypothetical protein [Tokyovirus A1]